MHLFVSSLKGTPSVTFDLARFYNMALVDRGPS